MKSKLFLLFIFEFCITYYIYPQRDKDQPGGKFVSSEGEINVLFVFAQFPDDSFDVDSPVWKKGDAPEPMKNKTWVEEKWTPNAAKGYLTDYFNVMSLSKLKFIGKMDTITAPHTRNWYIENNKKRNFIHQEILEELDKRIDFSEFDNWTYSPSSHKRVKDGMVDMIIIVWRNVNLEFEPAAADRMWKALNIRGYGDLGTSLFTVDEGKRKIKSGSGATIPNFYNPDPIKHTVHEFAHFLLGGNEYHNGFGFWAMLHSYGTRSYMINSFERHRLKWINLKTIKKGTHTYKDITLDDFITTGDGIRIEIDSSKQQYFYLENHQKISHWDYCSVNPNEKGLYVIRKDENYGVHKIVTLIPADGRFNWEIAGMEHPSYFPQGVPVFKRMNPDRINGYSDTDFIPFLNKGSQQTFEVIFYEDTLSGKPVDNPLRNGDGRDAFTPEFNNVFSPWSNPSSMNKSRKETGVGFYLKKIKNNKAILNIYYNTADEAPPSKPINLKVMNKDGHPLLQWDSNIEPDVISGGRYNIYVRENENTEPELLETTGHVQDSIQTWQDHSVSISGEIHGKALIYSISCIDNSGKESLRSVEAVFK